jgi:hypothetical protein
MNAAGVLPNDADMANVAYPALLGITAYGLNSIVIKPSMYVPT